MRRQVYSLVSSNKPRQTHGFCDKPRQAKFWWPLLCSLQIQSLFRVAFLCLVPVPGAEHSIIIRWWSAATVWLLTCEWVHVRCWTTEGRWRWNSNYFKFWRISHKKMLLSKDSLSASHCAGLQIKSATGKKTKWYSSLNQVLNTHFQWVWLIAEPEVAGHPTVVLAGSSGDGLALDKHWHVITSKISSDSHIK